MGRLSWYEVSEKQLLGGTAAGIASLGLLLDGWWRLRHTTLVAPLGWGVVAALTLIAAGWVRDPFVEYSAAVFMIAPTLALLGAKRPQNGAWQFIVLTLVVVLLLPAFQGLAFGDARPHVHTLFRWLIAVHIFIGAVNYLPTRFAAPAFAFAAAQALAAIRFLPGFDGENSLPSLEVPAVAGSLGLLIALGAAKVCAGPSAKFPPGIERVWHDFRDAYGLVWGLRIAERLNASAQKHGWPVEFAWGGMIIKTDDGTLDADVRHRVERELRSHLRRFVSHDWIARRLHESAASAPLPERGRS